LLYAYRDSIVNFAIQEINKTLQAKVYVSSVKVTFWSTFPKISIDFNDIFITDSYPTATNQDTLLYSDKVQLRFNPLDIWNEDYKVESIVVYPGTIQLKENEDGIWNYNIFKTQASYSVKTAFELELQKIQLKQVRFSFVSKRSQQKIAFRFDEANLSGNFNDASSTLNLDVRSQLLSYSDKELILIKNKALDLETVVEINQVNQTLKIPLSTLFVEKIPFEIEFVKDSNSFELDIRCKEIQLHEISNKIYQDEKLNALKASGSFTFDLHVKSEQTSPDISCSFQLKNASFVEPNNKIQLKQVNILGSYVNQTSLRKEELSLQKIQFSSKYGPFSGALKVKTFAQPQFIGNASGSLDLHSLSSLLAIKEIQELSGKTDVNTDFHVHYFPKNAQKKIQLHALKGSFDFRNVQLQLANDSRIFQQGNGKLFFNEESALIEDFP
jgi:hypothetical protein